MTPLAQRAPPPRHSPSPEAAFEILWASAVESFVSALVVSVLGAIALGIVGGLCEEMAPSLPPFLAGKPASHVAGLAHPWWKAAKEHAFVVLWVLFFVHTTWVRFTRPGAGAKGGKGAWVRRALARFSENWFELIVGNAFGAMVSALVLVWVQQFSFSQILLHWLLESCLAGLQNLAAHLFGTGRVDAVSSLFSWYADNQFKFTFWVLYISAICDDLGLPNFKTLARWAWRRFQGKCDLGPAPALGSLK